MIEELLKYRSISFVGMEKNAGKTEAMNYVLRLLHSTDKRIGLTSIGIDGETIDSVTKTSKPMVFIYPDTTFITSEKLYPNREIVSSVEYISKKGTSLGRLVFACSHSYGNVMLSGPTSTVWLKEALDILKKNNDICLIDGALSRKSFASPMVADAMILSTGAVVSANIDNIVDKTEFVYRLTRIKNVSNDVAKLLADKDRGVHAIKDNEVIDLQIPSLILVQQYKDKIFSISKTIYVAGMVSDSLLKMIIEKGLAKDVTIIVKDFTHIFSSHLTTKQFVSMGGKLQCLFSTNLLMITINPVSPLGYIVDKTRLLNEMQKRIPIPIIDVRDKV